MSRIWVTNESSSFARSFSDWCLQTNKHCFLNRLDNDEYDYFRQDNYFRAKEIDIFDPTLSTIISRSNADIIIHQLPITPERSYKHPDYALRNNIEGSFYVLKAAKEIGIPVLFITSKSINNNIYNITAEAVTQLINISNIGHVTVVPPHIYGPKFDEGISGLIKTALDKKEIAQLSIDPEALQAYMYVDDFFDALNVIINKSFSDEFDVIAQPNIEILPPLDEYVYLDDIFKILEEEDYCFNYNISLEQEYEIKKQTHNNILNLYNWKPKFNIKTGINDFIARMNNEKK